MSKLISKSKSQSLLPSSTTTTATDPITTQHHKVSSLPLNSDGVNNNNLSLLKVTTANNDGSIDFVTPDNNGNNNPYTPATTTLSNSENALPNFLKGGLRKSLTQVSIYIFLLLLHCIVENPIFKCFI